MEENPGMAHKIILNNRNQGNLTGILDVISFDENTIVLDTDMGLLTIKGKDLHVNRLSLEKGEIDMIFGKNMIDADALNAVSKGVPLPPSDCLLTPHPGEMSKLTGLTIEEIQKKRQEVAGTYSKQWNMVIVLKGHHTVIGFPSGTVWINQVDHPCLSVAGTGDVLAGILVSFLAQGLSIEDASRLAVYVHGSAGRRLGMRMGMRGVVATDLFNEIPQVIHEIDSNKTA